MKAKKSKPRKAAPKARELSDKDLAKVAGGARSDLLNSSGTNPASGGFASDIVPGLSGQGGRIKPARRD